MIENLQIKQKDIIERAAALVKPARREDFRKFCEDVLRARTVPYTNTDVRHAAASALLKFTNRRSR
jgi:hypothetical protein